MPVTTVLHLLDELVLNKTGERLNYIQKAIIKGSLEGQTYSEIADESHLSEGHIGDKGSELWKLLSDVLGVNISKSTARAILEKVDFYNNIGRDFVALNNVQICTESIYSKKAPPQPEKPNCNPI